jgi:hypothetical protein
VQRYEFLVNGQKHEVSLVQNQSVLELHVDGIQRGAIECKKPDVARQKSHAFLFAVPIEAAHSFEGLWDRGSIEGNRFISKDGVVSVLTPITHSRLKMSWGQKEFEGELKADGKLHWSDGDAWTREALAERCPPLDGLCRVSFPPGTWNFEAASDPALEKFLIAETWRTGLWSITVNGVNVPPFWTAAHGHLPGAYRPEVKSEVVAKPKADPREERISSPMGRVVHMEPPQFEPEKFAWCCKSRSREETKLGTHAVP